jgi:arginase
MTSRLTVVGVPSSAGAYAPGQERAPSALRHAGLLDHLSRAGVQVEDRGDVPGFRWRVDRARPRAMNSATVAQVTTATADVVADVLASNGVALVLGGDCTVELGTVAGASRVTQNAGLLYIDLDTDLNTPASTTDGALDWMVVAHLLDLPDTIPELTAAGARRPLLRADQVLYFGADNIEPFEREVIHSQRIELIPLSEVAADPRAAAHRAVSWARQFEKLLVHVDLDVLDYLDMPLAENNRRNWGLRFEQLMRALQVIVQAPHWSTLTICELNPDHGESDGSTLRTFIEALANILSTAPRLVGSKGQ